MATRVLQVHLTGDSIALERAFARAGKSAATAATGMEAAGLRMQKTGMRMQTAGRTLTRNVSLPMAAIGGIAVKMSADFSSSLNKMVGLVGISRQQVNAWRGDILNLSRDTAKSPEELADAMFFVTSAGLRGETALAALTQSAKAAAAGLGDTQEVADAVTSAMNAYGPSTLSAKKATDLLVGAVREGKLEASELAPNIGKAIPLASAMGVSFDEVAAAMAAMSRTGTSADVAATQIRATLALLLKPATQVEDAMEGIGTSADEVRASIKEKGLIKTLIGLFKAADGNQKVLGKLFPNVRALSGVMDLLGSNSKTNIEIFKNLSKEVGSARKAFKEMEKDPGFQMRQSINELKVAMVELGDIVGPVVIPILKEVAQDIGALFKGFSSLPGPVKKFGVELGIATILLGPFLSVTGRVVSAVGKLLTLTAALRATSLATAITGAFGTGSTFALSRSFGRGVVPSIVAQFGAAGSAGASRLIAGLSRALPVAAAAAGLGSIIYSATQGEWKDAGFKAGGALVGGIAGFLVGGPVGAMLGAGGGSLLGGLVGDLVSSEQREVPKLKQVYARVGDAIQGLRVTTRRLSKMRGEERRAARRVKRAEEQLNRVRKQHGPNSVPAIRAEVRYKEALQHTERVQRRRLNMERAHGAERQAVMEILRVDVRKMARSLRESDSLERGRLTTLARVTRAQRKGRASLADVREALRRYQDATKEGDRRQRKLSNAILEASKVVGPKFGGSMRQMAERIRNANPLLNTAFERVRALKEAQLRQAEASDAGSGKIGRLRDQLRRLNRFLRTSGTEVDELGSSIDKLPRRKKTEVDVKINIPGLNFQGPFGGGGGGGTGSGWPLSEHIDAKVSKRVQGAAKRNPMGVLGAALGVGGLGGAGGPGHVSGFTPLASRFGLEETSGFRPGDDGYHGINRARDYSNSSGPTPQMMAFAKFMAAAFGRKLRELIYTPLGFSIKDGAKVPPYARADHMDHVHVALQQGGVVPGTGTGDKVPGALPNGSFVLNRLATAAAGFQNGGMVRVMLEPGERVFTPGEVARVGMGNLEAVNRGIPRHLAKGGPLTKKEKRRFDVGRQDGGPVGLQKGGPVNWSKLVGSSWDNNELATLAHLVGMPNPGLMAQYAQGESSGNAGAVNHNTDGSVDRGLWQINSVHGFKGNLFDPWRNAQAAKSVLASQGLGAWYASPTGPKGKVDRNLANRIRAAMRGESADKGKAGSGGGGGSAPAPKTGIGGATAVALPGLSRSPLPKGGGALPGGFKSLLRSPGLGFSGKLDIVGQALEAAEGTAGGADDLAALEVQLGLQRGNRKRLRARVKHFNDRLRKPFKGLKAQQRRQQVIAKRNQALENLQTSRSGIAQARSSIEELAPTRRDFADLALARAEGTADKGDDIVALEGLKSVAEQELAVAKASGDPREIAEATRNLTQAAQALEAAQPTKRDFLDRDLALAELTEGSEDDRKVLERMLGLAEQELREAKKTADPRDDIEAARTLKQIRDQLKQIGEQLQIAEEMKALREELARNRAIAEDELATSAAVARRAIADIFAGELGARAHEGALTAGDGEIGKVGRL